jgi:hypothetical protein
MGSIRNFNPVKLFVGILVSNESLIESVEAQLSAKYGPVDYRSPVLPFTFTDYYRRETGDNIHRLFLSFERLIEADTLPEIKRHSNLLESEFAAGEQPVKRPVNLDPGYLEHAKVILASTKNFYHRMYLGGGIFGEVTMHFRNGPMSSSRGPIPTTNLPSTRRSFWRCVSSIGTSFVQCVC